MRLNDIMRFPHPVLSEITTDYVSGAFRYNFSHQIMADGNLKLYSLLSIENEKLSQLIKDGKIAVGYYLICSDTFYDELHITPKVESEIIIPAGKLFGRVVLRPIAWTTVDDVDLSSDALDPEFGSIIIPKGAIVALGLEHSFSMDPKKFQPIESIFELSKSEAAIPGVFLTDIESNKIKIIVENKMFDQIFHFRIGGYKKALLSCLYLPVLVEVLSRMTEEDEGKRWYQTLKAKADELGLDIKLESLTALQCAQQLLKEPINEFFKMMDKVG